MVAYKLKPNTKHHAWQNGELVRLNPGAILKTVSPSFKDEFEMIDDVPEDRIVKLDSPAPSQIRKHLIKEAVGQSELEVSDDDEEKDDSEVEEDGETDNEDDQKEEPSSLKAIHKRGSKWIVVNEEGEKVHTGYLTKSKAEDMAADA